MLQIPISQLKGLIQEKTSMPVPAQRLIFQARPLEDSKKLSDYGKCVCLLTLQNKATNFYLFSQSPIMARRSTL